MDRYTILSGLLLVLFSFFIVWMRRRSLAATAGEFAECVQSRSEAECLQLMGPPTEMPSTTPTTTAAAKCRDGYNAVAGTCWAKCPAGNLDVGALCREGCRENHQDVAGVCWEKCNGVTVGALCRERCREGYRDVAGVCWKGCNNDKDLGALCRERCRAGYKEVAGVCWKGLKSYVPKTYSKSSYVPKTNARNSYVPKTTTKQSYVPTTTPPPVVQPASSATSTTTVTPTPEVVDTGGETYSMQYASDEAPGYSSLPIILGTVGGVALVGGTIFLMRPR